MDPAQIMGKLRTELNKTQMLMDVLYATVERCGTQVEGFYSLRRINDLSGKANDLVMAASSIVDVIEVLQFLENLNATIEAETVRLDNDR